MNDSCARAQDGITLIMAVGILGVLSFTGATIIYYSSTNARSAEYASKNRETAYDLAEAGDRRDDRRPVNTARTTPQPDLLPDHDSYLRGRQRHLSGTLTSSAETWTMTSTGTVRTTDGHRGHHQRR